MMMQKVPYSNKIDLNKKVFVCVCERARYRFEDVITKKLEHKESTSADLQRTKRHVGATATQMFVFVTIYINHSGLFSSAQKLGTMAGK